jgi:hypothetical protein
MAFLLAGFLQIVYAEAIYWRKGILLRKVLVLGGAFLDGLCQLDEFASVLLRRASSQ